MLHIILKHVIWKLRIYNLFREIFKFRDFKKAFMNFAKSIIVHIFAIFEYFAKRTIYSDFPNHVLHNDTTCLNFKSLKFFRTSQKWPKFDNFAKITHKIAKSKYFSRCLK